MVEAVPKRPYHLYNVNAPKNALLGLIRRRQIINDEIFMQGLFINTLCSFPNLGTENSYFTDKHELKSVRNFEEHNKTTQSKYVLDDMANSHPRTLSIMSSLVK
jgi:hypothetical protein